jgi:hypothetical protein
MRVKVRRAPKENKMMNPFAALNVVDDADGTSRNRGRTTTTTSSSNTAANGGATTTRRRGRRNAETKRAVLLEAALLEAKRNAAHEAMEARETTDVKAAETWGKVGKGSGIKRSEAKKMAAALSATTTKVKGGKVDATAADADADDARNTTTTTTTVEKKSGVVTDETSTSSSPPPPVVSDVYKHVFEDTGATAWCVDVTDGIDGTVTRMSVTKAVPRMRKVSFKGKTTVVLAEEETTAVVRLWEEETRIDRARRAKARRKAAAKEAKEAQEAAVAVASTDENPPEPVVVASRPAAPPGFERAPMYSPTPPGFSAPTYGAQPAVRYVPIVDPNLEARQRQLEAQVAMLQAQLAAQANVGTAPARRAPPGFEANVENSSSTGGGKYVPPGRRR